MGANREAMIQRVIDQGAARREAERAVDKVLNPKPCGHCGTTIGACFHCRPEQWN